MGALAAPQVPDFVRLLYDIDELRVNSKEFQDKAKELRDRPDKVQATELEGEKREIYLHLGDFASGSLRLSQPPRVGALSVLRGLELNVVHEGHLIETITVNEEL